MNSNKSRVNNPRTYGWAASTALVVTLASSQAHAALMIGVKFQNGIGGATTPVTGTAGVVPMTGWNNISGTTVAGTPLAASDGTANAATLALTGGVGTWQSGVTADGGNGSLLSGYIDCGTTNAETATVAGLTAGGLYDVYVYLQGDGIRPGNDGDGLPNYRVNGGTIEYMENAAPGTFGATLTPGTVTTTQSVGPGSYAADQAAGLVAGNYIEFAKVPAVGGVISITAGADGTSFRSPFNGFELVSSAVPEPTSLGLVGLGVVASLGRRRRATSASSVNL